MGKCKSTRKSRHEAGITQLVKQAGCICWFGRKMHRSRMLLPWAAGSQDSCRERGLESGRDIFDWCEIWAWQSWGGQSKWYEMVMGPNFGHARHNFFTSHLEIGAAQFVVNPWTFSGRSTATARLGCRSQGRAVIDFVDKSDRVQGLSYKGHRLHSAT